MAAFVVAVMLSVTSPTALARSVAIGMAFLAGIVTSGTFWWSVIREPGPQNFLSDVSTVGVVGWAICVAFLAIVAAVRILRWAGDRWR